MPIDNSNHNTSTNLPANVAAFFAAFFPPLSGIFFIVFEKKNRLVRFHAMQSIVLGIFFFVGYLLIRFGVPLLNISPDLMKYVALGAYLFLVIVLVFWMVNVIAALCSSEWEIPVLGRIARRRLNKIDGRA